MSGIDAELEALFGEDAPVTADVIEPAAFHRAVNTQWERCKAWIAAGLEGDQLRLADVEAQLNRGDARLWPGEKCAILTEVVAYPSGAKVIQPIAAGGDLAEIERMIPGIEAAGRNEGCTVARIEGRRGWERRMKAFGYRFHSVILAKAI